MVLYNPRAIRAPCELPPVMLYASRLRRRREQLRRPGRRRSRLPANARAQNSANCASRTTNSRWTPDASELGHFSYVYDDRDSVDSSRLHYFFMHPGRGSRQEKEERTRANREAREAKAREEKERSRSAIPTRMKESRKSVFRPPVRAVAPDCSDLFTKFE